MDKPNQESMPKGFTCECGKFHEFGVYVAAHWTETLIHTCDNCGVKHSVRNGRTALVKAKRRIKTQPLVSGDTDQK